MKYFVSKSKVMFNLWSMTETQETINGRDYNVQHYKYERVLSKDFDKAMAKAPVGAEWNEMLINSYYKQFRRKQLIDNHTPDTFWFGKYFGRRFDEVNDPDYLRWYYSKVEFEDQKATIQKYLENLDWKLIDGEMVSPEVWNERVVRGRKLRRAKAALDTMTPLGIECAHSLRSDGTMKTSEGIILKFPYKVQYYDGYVYGLPLASDGSAKRIKNRKIVILSATLIQDDETNPTYEVKNWEFF